MWVETVVWHYQMDTKIQNSLFMYKFGSIKILIKENNCQKKLLIFNSLLSNVVVRTFKFVLDQCFKISIKLSVNVKESSCLQTRTDAVVTPRRRTNQLNVTTTMVLIPSLNPIGGYSRICIEAILY